MPNKCKDLFTSEVDFTGFFKTTTRVCTPDGDPSMISGHYVCTELQDVFALIHYSFTHMSTM